MITSMLLLGGGVSAAIASLRRRRKSNRLARVLRPIPKAEISESETTRNLTLATGMMALTIGGTLGFPLLNLISLPGLIYLNLPLLRKTRSELFDEQRAGIGLLDSVASVGMLALGNFFADALFLALFFLSRKLIGQTRDTSSLLTSHLPAFPLLASVRDETGIVQTSLDVMRVGDIVVLRAGDVIPADGVVIVGGAVIDSSGLFGAEKPKTKASGDSLYATTRVISGSLEMRVEQIGVDTLAAQMLDSLTQVAASLSDRELQGEQVVENNALPMLGLGLVTLPLKGPTAAVSVLVSYFGFDLRVIAPLNMLGYVQTAAKRRILIKDGRALELLREVDLVVFDACAAEQPEIGQVVAALQKREVEVAFLVPEGEGDTRTMTMTMTPDAAWALDISFVAMDELTLRRAGGEIVCLVGSGPDFAFNAGQIDLSISWQNGTKEAVDAAHIVLMTRDLQPLDDMFALSAELASHAKVSFLLMLAPSVLSLTGIFFFNFGVVTAIIFDYSGLVLGVAHASWPTISTRLTDLKSTIGNPLSLRDDNSGAADQGFIDGEVVLAT